MALSSGLVAQQLEPDSSQATATNQGTADRTNPSGWAHELSAGRFRVHCDFRLEAEDALLRELSDISEDVLSLLELPTTKEPIHIVLFATEAEYQRYMENYFPKLPKRRALFIQDRGPGMLFTHWHRNVAADLRHEVTHALLNRVGITLPLWLDEGLAEYFERRRGERFLRMDYLPEVAKLAKVHRLQTIHVLAKKSQVALLSNEDYRDSWAWVHFMIHRSTKTRAILVRYLHETLAHRNEHSGVFDLQRALWDLFPELHLEIRAHFEQVISTSNNSLLAESP